MNRTTKTILAALAIGLLGCGILCQQTQAVPITGDIEFFGNATASGPSGALPTTINFGNPWHSLAGTDSYAGVPFGTPTTFNSFSFIGDGIAASLIGPDTPLWTFAVGAVTYSFDLLNLTNAHTDAGSMAFTGEGIAHITGFDDTFATFGLQGAGSDFSFSISTSTTSTEGVPENGATIALLAIGLVGIGALRRKLAA